jgi:hypothetical protein
MLRAVQHGVIMVETENLKDEHFIKDEEMKVSSIL